jgi:hypothetical protein
MIDLELSWRAAAITAACLAGASVAVRRAIRPPRHQATANQAGADQDSAGDDQGRPWPRRLAMAAGIAQEAAILLALFALWQLAGSFSLVGPDGALARAQWIWHAERSSTCPAKRRSSARSLAIPCSSRRSTCTTCRCTSWC